MAMEFRHMFTADHHIFWCCIEPFLLIYNIFRLQLPCALTNSNESWGRGGGRSGGQLHWRVRSTDLEECLSMWSGEDYQPLPFCSLFVCRNRLCHLTSYNSQFHFCILCTTCPTLPCTPDHHANGVSEILHMGHPRVLSNTVKAWMCH